MKTEPIAASPNRYDIVAITSNDLVTDQRMQRCLTTLSDAGYHCLLLGRQRPHSKPLALNLPFDQERHELLADSGKRFHVQLNSAHRRRILQLRPRAVLVVDLDTMWGGASAARQIGVPWVYDAHELFDEQPEVARRWWIKATWQLFARHYIPHASAAYTVGAEIAKVFTARYHRPFEVIRNLPVSAAGQEPDSPVVVTQPSGSLTVLYQGALNEGRGLEELIDAAAELPDVTFWVAGTGPIAQVLRKRANDLALDNLTFFGELTPQQLREVTPKADVGYALMRAVSLNYYLSLSNKSVDYLRAGLPSLQMDWPEYRAIHEEYGCYHLVEEVGVAAVVAGINALLDTTYYMQLQKGCQAAAGDLSWEREEPKLVDIWREVFRAST